MEAIRYRVWALDVWGNPEDGFTVNDRRRTPHVILARGDESDASIVEALQRAGVLAAKAPIEAFELDSGDADLIFVDDAETGEPLVSLEREDES